MSTLQLDGKTRLYGIVGHPIAQVRSPIVMTDWLQTAGHNAVLLPLHVLPEAFETTLQGLMQLGNLDGLIFTVPYKPRVLALADSVNEMASRVGAANAMRRTADGHWQGGMFDGIGFVLALQDQGFEPRGKKAMMTGAGGAGSAIAIALADAGLRQLDVYDVDVDRARKLAERVQRYYPDCAARAVSDATALAGYDLLANCSPIGMQPGDGMPAAFGPLDPALRVVDIIMMPVDTPLLAHARACGCTVMNGNAMLAHQAQAMMTFLTDRS